MLDLVLIVLSVTLTAVTLLYSAACAALLRTDPTRDGGD